MQADEVPGRKAEHLRGGHGHPKAAGAKPGGAQGLEGRTAAKRASNPEPFHQVSF